MFTIQNQFLKATVKAAGAELCSLKQQQTEYIWQADPQHWARHAPILFPIVGKLKNESFLYKNNAYKLSQHGFARDKVFEVFEHSENKIFFELKSNQDTKNSFPFDFCLKIGYELHEKSLITRYEVENTSEQELYFSIGGHPAFCCPVDKDLKREDYFLEFEKNENAVRYLLTNGLFNGKTEKILENTQILGLTENLFDDDALVFKNLASQKVSLVSPKAKIWTFHFSKFPYLGIWSKSRLSPFVCIEPWFGLADSEEHDGDLSKKEGIICLETKQSFRCEYIVEIH